MTASALYEGTVMHRRFFPVRHRLSYRVWYLLLDLDELPELSRSIRGFAHNAPGIVSFWDRDHGDRDGGALRPWIERRLTEAGVDLEGGPIRILCLPRVLGYVFNPLSVWFCHHRDGSLRAVLYEVSNTFGQWHHYLLPVGADEDERSVRRSFVKELSVSPFIEMDARYDFTARTPDGRASVVVREDVQDGRVLIATLTARRRRLDRSTLAGAVVRCPLLTLKVIGGIHWEAVRLWLKGARYRPHIAAPSHDLTVVPLPVHHREEVPA